MKVVYIGGEHAEDNDGRLLIYILELEVGNRYTVYLEKEVEGKRYYKLEEFPDWILWLAECFVPCSNIDETEMVREYNKELV